MPRSVLRLAVLLAGVVSLVPAGRAVAARRPAGGIAIAKLVWTEGEVQLGERSGKGDWQRVAGSDALRTGDALRTADSAVARIEFPWMDVTLGPASVLSVPATTVLSTVLEQGRAEFSGAGRDIVKIEVGEGEVRGGGRLVLWRGGGRTSATALEGRFRVRAGGSTVELKAGEGTFVLDGQPPTAAVALPPAPSGLRPGTEAAYVRTGHPVELRWTPGGATAHHVELLALSRDEVLLAREATGSSLRLQIPWLGTYRWRVSARNGHGIESRPSATGFVCSVER